MGQQCCTERDGKDKLDENGNPLPPKSLTEQAKEHANNAKDKSKEYYEKAKNMDYKAHASTATGYIKNGYQKGKDKAADTYGKAKNAY